MNYPQTILGRTGGRPWEIHMWYLVGCLWLEIEELESLSDVGNGWSPGHRRPCSWDGEGGKVKTQHWRTPMEKGKEYRNQRTLGGQRRSSDVNEAQYNLPLPSLQKQSKRKPKAL